MQVKRWRALWSSVGVLSLLAAAAAFGATDVTVDTDTVWVEGAYDVDSLTVTNGATLAVAGGSTLHVATVLRLTGNARLVLGGKDITARVDGQWRGVGVAIDAERLVVEAGTMLSADGQGYRGGAGPGAGASDPQCGGPTAGAGGGHGGAGGGAAFGALGGTVYDDPLVPVEVGSGGGNNPGCGQTSTANAGGGAMRLQIGNVLQLDGMITANGAAGLAERLGGGAGGSIYVTTGVLTGNGNFAANGAAAGSPAAGGGGGGRIAVYYSDGDAFGGFLTARAEGSDGYVDGTSGSVAFVDTSVPNGHLHVYQQLLIGDDAMLTYEAITLENGATLRVGGGSTLDVAGELAVTGHSTLQLGGKNTAGLVDGHWRGEGVALNAGRVTVEAGSTISADGEGYRGTMGPGAGASDPQCGGPTAGGGGGYGGAGGNGMFGAAGGEPYGSPVAPTDLGSGGGNNPGCNQKSTVNAGGGAIRLTVAQVLQLDGTISADGAAGLAERLGGGSGGSLYVTTRTLTGTGLFSANGADAGSFADVRTAGGGGGGRIAVYYEESPNFTGFISSSATGGAGATAGAPGSVAFVDTSGGGQQLHVYRDLAFEPDSTLDYTAITLENGALLQIGGGSTINVSGDLTVRGKATLQLQGKNTDALVDGYWRGEGVAIDAGRVTVEAGSTISADGEGYRGTMGQGAGASDPQCAGPTAGAGGGYGGAGGDGMFGAVGGQPYGSAVAPTDLGSGGGNNPGCNQKSTANAGGGAIRLTVAQVLQLDGTISADGAAGLAERLGGGAGGSLYVTTQTLRGSGVFSADGADGGTFADSRTAGGGGGGRIAVYAAQGAAFNDAASHANGGDGFATGASGTLTFVDTQCDGDCHGADAVSVVDLIIGVNIALGTSSVTQCPAIDSDGNGAVTVDDIIRAVNRALGGC